MNDNLKIIDLGKKYAGFTLENINFSVPKGSIMGLIGENGAGKTTIIKAILNLIKKDCGEIAVFGMDNIAHEIEIKSNLGVVLDDSLFYESLNAYSVSSIMKGIYKNWDNECYLRYIKKFNIESKKKVKEYSKGMKMKLSLAVALSHNAKMLILDEALSGVDPVIRSEILDVFLEFIMDADKSILISSHIISGLEKICDYITFVHDGKVVFSEPKDDLIYEYGVVKCSIDDFSKIDKEDILGYRKNSFGVEVLIKNKRKAGKKYSNFVVDKTNIEEIMIFLIKGDKV